LIHIVPIYYFFCCLFTIDKKSGAVSRGVSVKAPSFSLLRLLKRKVRFEGGRLKDLGGSILSERRVDEIVCGLQIISEQNTI